MTLQKFILFAAACAMTAGSLAITSPASAQPSERFTVTGPRTDAPRTERVSYRDLNLVIPQDEKRLVRRVGFAVNHVCPQGIFRIEPSGCRSDAWDGAKPQIALAVERAKQIASNGFSSIAPVAIVISVRQ